jgi:4-diphosphocytidyl-2-C-methyl-D-erythritol kinase
MITFPNAKINIGLHIINRRADQYHNIETIFLPIKIKDALELVESKELHFSSSGLTIPDIPGDPKNNLCLKAYKMILKDFSIPPVHIHLHKHIPIGAGLGGGSADAAFCIKLLNEKFSLNLNMNQMETYAKKLGSDCAFFIQNQTALATEKGDQLRPIQLTLENYYLVVVMPRVHISTHDAYKQIMPSPPSYPLEETILLPIEEWKNYISNSFEVSVFKNYPLIANIKSALYEANALYASMSGSGASVYGIFKEETKLPKLEKNNQVFYNVGL